MAYKLALLALVAAVCVYVDAQSCSCQSVRDCLEDRQREKYDKRKSAKEEMIEACQSRLPSGVSLESLKQCHSNAKSRMKALIRTMGDCVYDSSNGFCTGSSSSSFRRRRQAGGKGGFGKLEKAPENLRDFMECLQEQRQAMRDERRENRPERQGGNRACREAIREMMGGKGGKGRGKGREGSDGRRGGKAGKMMKKVFKMLKSFDQCTENEGCGEISCETKNAAWEKCKDSVDHSQWKDIKQEMCQCIHTAAGSSEGPSVCAVQDRPMREREHKMDICKVEEFIEKCKDEIGDDDDDEDF